MNVKELKAKLDPLNKNHQALSRVLSTVQVLRGEDGYTPVKGKDYFTDAEIASILSLVESKIRTFERGLKGERGQQGETGARGLPGKDGYTPIKGKDYFTPEEINEIVFKAVARIKVPKDGVSPNPEAVARLVLKNIKLPENTDMVSKKELAEFLKRGGFRGGGDTVEAGSGISITNVNGVKQISAIPTSFTLLDATGSVDDSNTTFTFTSAPTIVVINGGFYRSTSTIGGVAVWTIVGLTVTTAFPVGTGGDIYGIA